MLSVNNQALPDPGGLRLLGIPALPGEEPLLLRVEARWAALQEEQLLLIAGLCQGTFTLALKDPRRGAWRGFPAKLSGMDIALLWAPEGAPALWQLFLQMDELGS